jgi:two-component system chemotaxis sensor kinase CheA
MNEFLDQFLVESRELVEQGTSDLLALEERPDDRERLDGAFRAFHTLKGAAGIMDFGAMGRALHAAEDLLASARAGSTLVTPTLVSDCLTCLDQIIQWLDAWETSGDLPANADADADALVRRLAPRSMTVAPATAQEDWVTAFLAARPELRATAALALRYAPGRDSFYRGIDPLAALEDLPGLIALDVRAAEAWGALDAFDPFACQVRILVLFSENSAILEARLQQLEGEAELVRLMPPEAAHPHQLSAPGADLLRAQILMLAASHGEDLVGCIASAARVAGNILRRAGRVEAADRVEGLARSNPANPGAVSKALEDMLAGTFAGSEADHLAAHARTDATLRGLRVDVQRVDALVNLTGELTVAKNALGHAAALARSERDPEALSRLLREQHAQLDRLVAELQRAVLHLRVLPMRQVFQRFPRLVREMVVALDKPARLVTEGDATEADKAVVESLFEPLLHVLRNALDHGVEPAEERAAAGKPPSATITLRARREGEHVVVEVQDDGRGIDVERVRETALQRGLVAPETLQNMSNADITDLVFAPGFSTAQSVTAVSGRGVGMDAVRTAVERMGGRVTVESEAGAGALVRFMLPFTVMMSRVMTVEAGGQMFGIPLESVVETLRAPRDQIVAVGAARAFVLRERTIPLIDLRETLGLTADTTTPDAAIIVAIASGHIAGLEVDQLGERLDIMLKPLDGLLAQTPGIAGASLLGDGRVLLVLDLQELLQ